jgi:predicted RNase H-like HicB family nuclease
MLPIFCAHIFYPKPTLGNKFITLQNMEMGLNKKTKTMKKIEMIIERTKTGYSAYAAKYPVYTVGSTLEELKSNMLEALNLHFEEEGKMITEKNLKVTLDLPQFFEFYKVINAKALSERIGINQSLLAQYIIGVKKPSPSQTQRILKGVQQIGRELAEIRFLL